MTTVYKNSSESNDLRRGLVATNNSKTTCPTRSLRLERASGLSITTRGIKQTPTSNSNLTVMFYDAMEK